MENNQFYFFDQLSNEIKVLIIQKCDIKTVLNLSQTCKLMNEIIHFKHSNIIFKELFYSTWKIEPLEYIISNWKYVFMKAHEIFQNFKSIDGWEEIERYIQNEIQKDVLNDKVFFQDFIYQIGIQLFPKSSALFGNYANLFVMNPFSFEFKKRATFFYEKAIEYEPENAFPLSNYALYLFDSLENKNKRDEKIEKKIISLFQKGIDQFSKNQDQLNFLKNSLYFSDFYFEIQNDVEKAYELISNFDMNKVFESKCWFYYFKIFLKQGKFEYISNFLNTKKTRYNSILNAIINFEKGNKQIGQFYLYEFIQSNSQYSSIDDFILFIFKNYSNLLIDFEKNFELIFNSFHPKSDYRLLQYVENLGLKEKLKEKKDILLLDEKFPNKINILNNFFK